MKQQLAVAVALSALFLAVGCGGSDDSADPPPTERSSTPSPTATSDGPVAPASVLPTRPDDVNSEQGARNFSIFVMQNIVYSISTNEVDPLLALSDGDSCKTCIGFDATIADRGQLAQVPVGNTAIEDITVEQNGDSRYVVRQTLAFPEVEITDLETGEVSETNAPSELKLTSVVVWKDDQWRLENYGTKEG